MQYSNTVIRPIGEKNTTQLQTGLIFCEKPKQGDRSAGSAWKAMIFKCIAIENAYDHPDVNIFTSKEACQMQNK